MSGFKGLFKGIVGGAEGAAGGEADQGGMKASAAESLNEAKSGLFNTSSNFFSSVQAKKEGLMSNISNTLEHIKVYGDEGDSTPNAAPQSQHNPPQQTAAKVRPERPGGGYAVSSDDEDGSSSASEYGDGGDVPNYEATDGAGGGLERANSSESLGSLPEEETRQYRQSIHDCMRKILNANEQLSPEELQNFKPLVTHHTGRSAYIKELKAQIESNFEVSHAVLCKLAEFTNAVVEQCEVSEDIVPATLLMQLSFQIYYEDITPDSRATQIFLYTKMKDQRLWQSIRFWNAAFFMVLQKEHAKVSNLQQGDMGSTEDALEADKNLHEEVAFFQISKFLWNMYALGITKETCAEFLRKHSGSASLRKGKRKILRENLNKFFEDS